MVLTSDSLRSLFSCCLICLAFRSSRSFAFLASISALRSAILEDTSFGVAVVVVAVLTVVDKRVDLGSSVVMGNALCQEFIPTDASALSRHVRNGRKKPLYGDDFQACLKPMKTKRPVEMYLQYM